MLKTPGGKLHIFTVTSRFKMHSHLPRSFRIVAALPRCYQEKEPLNGIKYAEIYLKFIFDIFGRNYETVPIG